MEDYKFQKLTAQEIAELQVEKAEQIILKNSNNLADIEKALFDALAELGKYRIKVEQLKSLKSMIIEQNRGLAKVIQNG